MTTKTKASKKRPWQCFLSERDWAIVAASWDNSMTIEEGVKRFSAWELEAKSGHYGSCTKEAEACIKCMVRDYYKLGLEMRGRLEKKNGRKV